MQKEISYKIKYCKYAEKLLNF